MIPFLSFVCCDLCFRIPRILAADASTGAIVVAACYYCLKVSFLLLFLLLFFYYSIFLNRTILRSYDYKHGDRFQLWIPHPDSKSGIEHPILISGSHNNQCLRNWSGIKIDINSNPNLDYPDYCIFCCSRSSNLSLLCIKNA